MHALCKSPYERRMHASSQAIQYNECMHAMRCVLSVQCMYGPTCIVQVIMFLSRSW